MNYGTEPLIKTNSVATDSTDSNITLKKTNTITSYATPTVAEAAGNQQNPNIIGNNTLKIN